MDTVNYELGPWIRMSAPDAWRRLKLEDWSGIHSLFESWILLFGVVPIDRHAFGTLDLGPERKFVETSTSWINRHWRHERVVAPAAGGCEIVDSIDFAPRLRALSAVLEPVYRLVFRHRHARLRARYGSPVHSCGGSS